MKKRALVFGLTILLLLTGCTGNVNVKSPTDMTPLLKSERHSFELQGLDSFAALNPENSNPADSAKVLINSGIKVGFIFIGHTGDYGFTYAQNQGRLALMDELGVETIAIENVAEDESCLAEMQNLIDRGCTAIFTCSYGFMDYTYQMAVKYPNLYFFHCSGYKMRENMSIYFGRMYQIRYLTGIVAGLRTITNQIGYIAAFPIAEVVRGADAFALGVKSVNPEAIVKLRWSYTWYDSALEKQIAFELIDIGCDVIAQHQDTVSPQVAAQEKGVWSIGYNSPMGFFAPDAYLTGAIWNWGPYLIDQVRKIDNGTWAPSSYWGGIEDDVVRLDSLTENNAPGAQEAVNRAIENIKGGFDIFEGPLYDNEGALRVPEGIGLTDEEKLSLDWFVDNIEGRVDNV